VKKRSAKVKTDGEVLMDHIRELRTRLIVCAVVLIVGGIVGYFFYTPILEWLRSPLGHDLYYSTPAGSFNFIIKVASMVGILAAVPFIIYQLIMFVQPVFAKKLSTRRVFAYTITSILLAVTGAMFAFYAILPGALKFFAGFQVAGLSALIDANNYLNFVTNAIVTFIIVFQIPLLMVIIDRIKPIAPKKLFAMEKYVIVAGLLVSLVVPFAMDITTSLLIASPIIILYNLSVVMIVVRHFVARRKQVRLPVIVPLTAKEMALDDELVTEFFTGRRHAITVPEVESIEDEASLPVEDILPQSVDKEVVPAITNSLPRDHKPLQRDVIDAEQLRAEARAKREQQIAERVALYNSSSFKIINDIH